MASPPALFRRHARRWMRRTAIGLSATVLATVAVVGSGLPAEAKPTAAQVQKQIDTLNNQIETLVEQYNLAVVKLNADKVTQAKLTTAIGPAQLQAELATQRIGMMAAQIYEAGPNHSVQLLMSASSTTAMLNALGSLNAMAHQQRVTIDGASSLIKKYKQQQAPLNALIQTENATVASLATKKKTIVAQLAVAKKLQDSIGGGGGTPGTGGGSNVGSGPYVETQLIRAACPGAGGSGNGLKAAQAACNLVWQANRKPHPWVMYGWGTAGPNTYDCSGLVMAAWKAAGVSLAHSSYTQHSKETTKISKSQLQPGDLVFYNGYGHVAIYVGGGWIVQAEHTGAPIKMDPVGFETVDSYGRVKQ